MLLIVWFNWIGSAVSGFLHQLWWLVVPPAIFSAFTMWQAIKDNRYAREIGLSGRRINLQMLGPSVMLVLWNTVLNGAIFAVFWLISRLIGR
jgi:hypothetical protein